MYTLLMSHSTIYSSKCSFEHPCIYTRLMSTVIMTMLLFCCHSRSRWPGSARQFWLRLGQGQSVHQHRSSAHCPNTSQQQQQHTRTYLEPEPLLYVHNGKQPYHEPIKTLHSLLCLMCCGWWHGMAYTCVRLSLGCWRPLTHSPLN